MAAALYFIKRIPILKTELLRKRKLPKRKSRESAKVQRTSRKSITPRKNVKKNVRQPNVQDTTEAADAILTAVILNNSKEVVVWTRTTTKP